MKVFFRIILLVLFILFSEYSYSFGYVEIGSVLFCGDKLESDALVSLEVLDSVNNRQLAKSGLIDISTCVNSIVTFTNSAIPGGGNGCANVAKYIWDFGDGTSAISTQLTSPQSKTHVYTTPGKYTATLTAQNGCGTIVNTQQVCVESSPVPSFTLDNNLGCAPLVVQATNQTNTTALCSSINYNWEVSYSPGNCGTVGAYSFTNGSNSSSANPTFNFTNPGIYVIKLSVSNLCGTYSTTQLVTVKQPPTAIINNIPDFCGTATVNPTATVNSCSDASNPLTYNWSFPGGLPSSSTSSSPSNIFYSTPGQYTVSLSVTNECGVSTITTKQFTINKVPNVTTSPLKQSVCSGLSTTPVNLTADIPGTTFSWMATASLGVSGFTPSGTTDVIPSQTLSTTATTIGTVTYSITPLVNGCTGPVTNYVVNVNPAPVITTQPVSSSVCVGATLPALTVAFAPVVDTPIYQWYSSTGSNPGVLILGATNASYTPSTSAVGTTNYYCVISFSSGVCASLISNPATIVVNALPTISPQPISTQSICVGGLIGAPLSVGYTGGTGTASYQWYSNTSNSSSGGTAIPGATASTFLPPVFNSTGSFYYYAEVNLSGSNCGVAISNPAQIIVVADPVVNIQPIVTQTICQNSTPATLTVGATGGLGTYNYQWYQNATSSTSGGTAIPGATTNSYDPSTATVGTSYYYCEITQTGLNCIAVSKVSEVIINAQPSATTQPVSSAVCVGGTPTQLSVSASGGVGAPTYQWFSNTVNSTVGGTPVSGATTSTFNPTATVQGTTYYYCVISFSQGGCGSVTSNIATVIADPVPTISTQPVSTQSICVGGSIGTPLSVGYTGGTGTASYQWYSNTGSSSVGGTAIPGATASTFMPPAFNSTGTFYYYVEVSLSGSNCGLTTSTPAQIIVVADPVVNAQPLATQTICQGSTPATLTVGAIGGLGAYNYQWYQNATSSTSGGTAIPGATANSYDPSTATVGTSYYYCEITQTGLNCNAVSVVSEVIVNAQPTVATQPVSSTVCVGGTPTQLSVSTSGGVGAPAYQWFSNTVNAVAGGVSVSGAIASTFSPTANVVGTTYYYCVISFWQGGCGSVTSNIATVTANPIPKIGMQPLASQEICNGTTIGSPLSVSYVDGTGTPTYQWYSNSTNSSVGGTPIAGAISSTFMPPAFTASGNYHYYVSISLSGNGCGSIVSDPARIIVDANPVISPVSVSSQSVCINTVPQTLSISASGGLGAYTYQWYENAANNSTSGIAIGGATASSYIPLTTSLGTKYYYCEVKSSLGASCSFMSDVATVIVNPEPTFTSQPISSTVCVGGSPATLSVSYKDGAGTPAYQWFSNTVDDSSTGTPISLATNSTYNPSSAVAGTLYYYCVITLSPGGCSAIVSNTAKVVVNPNPVISTFSREICNGTAFSVTPDVTNGDIVPVGTTYTWGAPVVSPAGAVTGASAESTLQSTISQTLTNNTTSAATVTYTVTPLSGACPGNDFSIVVTVNSTITPVVSVQNITCFGLVDGSLAASISGGVAPYTVAWSGPRGFTSNALNLSNLYAGDYTLTVTDSKNCQVSSTYTIVEPAKIKITTDIHKNNTFYGADNGIIGITISGGTPPYSYAWTKDGVPYATTEDLNNIGPGYYEVTVTDIHNCDPKHAFYDVTVPPELIITLINRVNENCYGDKNGAITLDVVGGTPIEVTPGVYDYLYSWTGPHGYTSTTKNLTNLAAGTYLLEVTDNSGFSKQLSVVITQPDSIGVTVATVPKLDCATKVVSEVTTATIKGGVPPYQLLWSRGTVSGSNNETMESSQAGPVNLQVTDSRGCVTNYTFNLSIAPVGIRYKPIDCDKHIYQFDAIVLDPSLAYTYAWDFGDSGTDTNKTANHAFAAAGNYNVKLTVSSAGCTVAFNQTITVEAPPVLKLDKDPKVCVGDSTIIHVSGANTYLWNDNSTADSIMVKRTGEYSVTGTSVSGCTAVLKFVVSNFDLLKYTVQSDKNEISTTNATIRLWSESIPSTQYFWDFGDGKSDKGNNLDHVYDITTEKYFDVKLKVINPNGCTEEASKRILVVNGAMYNTFSPNGDGIDDVFMKSWHIKVYNRNGILLYDGSDGWDGTYKGKPVANDTYFYVLYYSATSETKTNSGYVTVVR